MGIISTPITAKTVLCSKDTQFLDFQNICLSIQQRVWEKNLNPSSLSTTTKNKQTNKTQIKQNNKINKPQPCCSAFPKEKARLPKKYCPGIQKEGKECGWILPEIQVASGKHVGLPEFMPSYGSLHIHSSLLNTNITLIKVWERHIASLTGEGSSLVIRNFINHSTRV